MQPSESPSGSPALRPLTSQLTGIHAVMILPEWATDIGRRYDADAFVRDCADTTTGILEYFIKGPQGYPMLPLGDRPCPKDWATPTRTAAAKAGLKFIAYYNIGMDNWIADRHPQWRCVKPDGQPNLRDNPFYWLCLNSPWRDRIFSELAEIVQKLKPDGVFLDMAGMPNAYGSGQMDPAEACHCTHCLSAYRAKYQCEMPGQTDDPQLREQVFRFGHEGRTNLLRDAYILLKRLGPDMIIGSNGSGYYDGQIGTPDDVNAFTTYHSSEGKEPRFQSYKAKLMWSLAKPYQMHTYGTFLTMENGSAIGTWVDWNLLPADYLEVSTAMVTAHAGRLVAGVNLPADGTFFPGQLGMMKPAFAAARAREPWLAGLRSVPNIAVVYDARAERVLRALRQSNAHPIQEEARGLHDALLDGNHHFDVVNAADLRIEGHRALVFADAAGADEAVLPALRQFVADGGLLVATHETSLRDAAGKLRENFAWAELLGVRYNGRSPYSDANWAWLNDDLRGALPPYPVLFTTEVLDVTCTTATMLAERVHPERPRTHETYLCAASYNHFKHFTGKPLITLNRIGRGAVIYVAAPLGRQILARGDTNLKTLVGNIVRRFATDLAIKVQAPPGIMVVFGRRSDGPNGPALHTISLVNRYSGAILNSPDQVRPRVGPVSLRVPLHVLPQAPQKVEGIDTRELTWKIAGGELQIEVANIGHHAVIAIC
jgi:hypothetical protein